MQKGVEPFSEKGFSVTMLTPSVSRASICAILAPCHRATFSCALHARGIILPDDSWVASGAGSIKNVLRLFVLSWRMWEI